MCGYPASGKTTHAQAIALHLSARGARVHVVNDESLGLVRATAYANPAAEKVARGLLKAAVEQLLSKDDVVIADGCNYIKGFRYELYVAHPTKQYRFCVTNRVGTAGCD